ncbi:MAG: hypothetical protein LRY40_06410, partial [Shewanella fodinae]|nr:hypothetical protein [Shewanella fodinae]
LNTLWSVDQLGLTATAVSGTTVFFADFPRPIRQGRGSVLLLQIIDDFVLYLSDSAGYLLHIAL